MKHKLTANISMNSCPPLLPKNRPRNNDNLGRPAPGPQSPLALQCGLCLGPTPVQGTPGDPAAQPCPSTSLLPQPRAVGRLLGARFKNHKLPTRAGWSASGPASREGKGRQKTHCPSGALTASSLVCGQEDQRKPVTVGEHERLSKCFQILSSVGIISTNICFHFYKVPPLPQVPHSSSPSWQDSSPHHPSKRKMSLLPYRWRNAIHSSESWLGGPLRYTHVEQASDLSSPGDSLLDLLVYSVWGTEPTGPPTRHPKGCMCERSLPSYKSAHTSSWDMDRGTRWLVLALPRTFTQAFVVVLTGTFFQAFMLARTWLLMSGPHQNAKSTCRQIFDFLKIWGPAMCQALYCLPYTHFCEVGPAVIPIHRCGNWGLEKLTKLFKAHSKKRKNWGGNQVTRLFSLSLNHPTVLIAPEICRFLSNILSKRI